MRLSLMVLFFAALLYAQGSYQLPLKPGVWHLVGVNGFHHNVSALDNSFESGGSWVTIREDTTAGRVSTWDYIDESTKSSGHQPNMGDPVYSTLGIMLDPAVDSGLEETWINYQQRPKDPAKPMLSMMISSQGHGRRADIRIDFQSDYQGETFYIRFFDDEGGSLVMEGVFDPRFTRDRPAKLRPRVQPDGYVTRIRDIVDMNLSDNNTSALHLINVNDDSLFATHGTTEVGGRQRLGLDDRITAYHWSARNQLWSVYASDNSEAANDFNHLEPGKAYWIRLDTPQQGDEAGLLLGHGGIDEKETYRDGLVQNRWNLLSFEDSYLREVPSAIFIPVGGAGLPEIVVRDNFRRDAMRIEANEAPLDAAQAISHWAYSADRNGSHRWQVRAYPAYQDGSDGLLVISDEDFEIEAAGARSASGRDLFPGSSEEVLGQNRTFMQSRIDEYLIAIRPNTALYALDEKAAAVGIAIPGGGASIKVDLSQASNFNQVREAFESALQGAGDSVIKDVVALDSTYDGDKDTLLLAASKRLFVRDNTHMRLFEYTPGAGESFRLRAPNTPYQLIAYADSTAELVENINQFAGALQIRAYEVNATGGVLLASSHHRSYELQEFAQRTQFKPVGLGAEINATLKGAIDEVYSPLDLARVAIGEDSTPYQIPVMTDDLSFSAKWAPDFPLTGPLYSLRKAAGANSWPEVMVGGVTRHDETIFWRQADLTMPVYEWKETSSRFNLFRMHKERGYWVYMRSSGASEDVTKQSLSRQGRVSRNYSNHFEGGSGSVAATHNHIDLDIEVNAGGLEGMAAAAGEMPETVQVHIEGEVVPLIKSGSSFTYLGELSSHDQPALAARNNPEPPVGMSLYISNGRGALLEENFTFNNIQPDVPDYHFDLNITGSYNGGLVVNIHDASKIRIYEGNISDVMSQNKLIWEQTLGANSGEHSLHLLGGGVDGSGTITYATPAKPYYDLRLIGEGGNQLHSDVRRVLYAPLYKGTDMISTALSDPADTNATPIRFSHTGQSYDWVYDNNNQPTDGGVQLQLGASEHNASDTNTTILIYKSEAGVSLDQGPADFIGLQSETGDHLATVGYMPAYRHSVFYLYSPEREQLYYGIFPDTNGLSVDYTLKPIETDQRIHNFHAIAP